MSGGWLFGVAAVPCLVPWVLLWGLQRCMDLHNRANALRPTLSKHKVGPYDQELRAVEELESDARAVAGAKHFVLADGLDARRLAHSDGVDHGSVPRTHGGGVHENHNLRHEEPRGLRIQAPVHQHHALAHVVLLELVLLALQSHGHRLPGHRRLHGDALVADALHLHLAKRPRGVRAQQHGLAREQAARQKRSRDNGADALHGEAVVHVHPGRAARRLRPLSARRKVVEEAAQEVDGGPRDAGGEEDGHHRPRGHALCARERVLPRAHHHRQLGHARTLEHLVQAAHRLLQHVLAAHVDLVDDDERRHLEGESDAQVLLGHSHQPAAVAVHRHHSVVGEVPREAEERRLEVALVPGQIEKRQHLGAGGDDVAPGPVVNLVTVSVVEHLPSGREAQHLVADARGAPAVQLVLVAENVHASRASAVVQLALGQHAQQSALAAVHVPARGHTNLHVSRVHWSDSNQHRGGGALGAGALHHARGLRVELRRHLHQIIQAPLEIVGGQASHVAVVLHPDFVQSLSLSFGQAVLELRHELLEPLRGRVDQVALVLVAPGVVLRRQGACVRVAHHLPKVSQVHLRLLRLAAAWVQLPSSRRWRGGGGGEDLRVRLKRIGRRCRC
mmetsp:Transcript_43646/g.83286  ORF Transcript_43646/g.83286 Transcript_43646/m.83286 type:complete len:618 (+) Transcript_43646:353-2206(+)